jgi:FlaA1/EpsC-like NDP-sugar epimerase
MKLGTVLVTGAGGFIGSALVKAIAAGRADRIVLLDSSEQNLFGIHRCLEALPHEAILGSVTDASLLNSMMRRFRPEIVYHAAALKHVPLLELNPLAAVRNNALGTYTLAQAAIEQGVPALVLVSTDKAVNPHSIMGASKRLAELTVAALSGPQCRMNAVRLGNVIGSTGSVVPIFQEQISQGGPVTVTHPEATRYFMLLDDAVEAIMEAGAAKCSGNILLPELGEPESIADLARSLVEESGEDIAIRFIGLRPGEKLHEDLIGEKERCDGGTIRTPSPAPAELHGLMAQIACLLACGDVALLIETICKAVPEYRPSAVVGSACT